MNKKANGARVANAKLTEEQRKQKSREMNAKKKYLRSLPKANYKGLLPIADMTFNCCVLEDGRRLISETDIQEKLGGSGGKTLKLRDSLQSENEQTIPLFLASKPLIPIINQYFTEDELKPIEYNLDGKCAKGYNASILPKVCEIWLEARDKDLLQIQQLPKARKAELLIRGFARVGIIALIDEVTGYQKDRERDALAKILEAYVAKELQPYVKTFDAEFYEEMFRLRGLPYPPAKANFRPQYFGILTNNIVYDRLAPGIRECLKKEAKKISTNHKLFQHLTADYGRQELIKHLGICQGLMKVSPDWDHFIQLLDQVKPKLPSAQEIIENIEIND